MYRMHVKVDSKWLTIAELKNGLDQIHSDVKKRKIRNPMNERVQILTSDERTTWATNREKLISGKCKMCPLKVFYEMIYKQL